MPTIYRIVHEQYKDDPFSGEGGLHNKSRWASKGQLVSYASDHPATATLEKLAGMGRADLMAEMIYVKAQVDRKQEEVLPEDNLPENWNALPSPEATRAIGDAWLEAEEHVILRVPSVVLPDSYNYVINASHPDITDLRVLEVAPLLLDNRVLARIGSGSQRG